MPACENPGERAKAKASLRYHLERYNAAAFPLAWSADHIKAMDRIERVVQEGGLFALAMQRGGGKTTLFRCASEWAVLHGFRRWPCIIGATDAIATRILVGIKKDFLFNSLLLADFPEAIYPIVRLENEGRRCKGQLFDGELTGIEWSDDRIVFATIPGHPEIGGSVISVCGLTGAIRGQVETRQDGTTLRPDLVFLDDPQTKESARSISQTRDRLEIINGDVLGLAGPTTAISAFCACTTIEENDLADQLLTPEKYPEWHGERCQMINRFPTNLELWDQYRQLREESPEKARGFYVANREAMDAGSEVAWEARVPPGFESALEFAMSLRFRNPFAFDAEYQNTPNRREQSETIQLDADILAKRLNRIKRGAVATESTRLTAFIDVQQTLLYWMVMAWEEDFTGAIVDYGTFPQQPITHFLLREARATLATAFPGVGIESQIYQGLDQLTRNLLGREWPLVAGGGMPLQSCVIDSGYQADVVRRLCRQSEHRAVLIPSKGYGISAAGRTIDEWTVKLGSRRGPGWIISPSPGRMLLFDANHWKSFVAARLLAPMGSPGAITFAGDSGAAHRMLIEHVTAERREPTFGRGRSVDAWKLIAGRENHWWDCMVGATASAATLGVILRENVIEAPRNGKRMTFREAQEAARAKRNGM